MKILRIFGVVVGVHVFALMLIFANPGCSSTNKPPASANESNAGGDDGSSAAASSDSSTLEPSPVSAAPTYGATSGEPAGVRFSPTRPGTAAADVLEAQPVADVTPATTYTVVPGDSLWTIARRNGITVAELAAANNLERNGVVQIGQRLIIPTKAVAGSSMSVTDPVAARGTTPAPTARAPRETVKHVVRSGETLGGIARKYQVKVGEIATANNIADPAKIRPGMELTIPGWQAPATRSTTASPSPAAPAPSPAQRETSPEAPSQQPAAEVPTLVIPPPETEEAPPVIRVDDTP